MPLIYITDNRTDDVLDYIEAEDILENEHFKSMKNNVETFNFTTLSDRSYSEHLNDRNRVIIPNENGSYMEFIIFETVREHYETTVFADASFLELAKARVINPATLYGQTAQTLAQHALENTTWEVGNVDYNGTRMIQIDDYTNPYDLLKRVETEFDLEMNFRVEVNGNRITHRYVDFVLNIGEFTGRTVEFGYDLLGLERTERNDEIVTALVGLGPEREDGTRLETFVEDRNALDRWGINGNHLIEIYEPQTDNLEMTETELRQLTEIELNKRINSVVEYKIDVLDLDNVVGQEFKDINYGDIIRVIDRSFNPPLYIQARVHSISRDILTDELVGITLGDFIEYTEDEVTAVYEELREEIRNKIDQDEIESEIAELTYTKTTIDQKDSETLQSAEVDASAKVSSAETSAKTYADGVADTARQDAINYTNQNTVSQTTYNQDINDIMQDLGEKIGAEWVNGQLRLTDSTNDFGVYTIDQLDGMFNNVVSTVDYNADQQGIVETLNAHTTSISQNAEDIKTKVSETIYNKTLSGLNADQNLLRNSDFSSGELDPFTIDGDASYTIEPINTDVREKIAKNGNELVFTSGTSANLIYTLDDNFKSDAIVFSYYVYRGSDFTGGFGASFNVIYEDGSTEHINSGGTEIIGNLERKYISGEVDSNKNIDQINLQMYITITSGALYLQALKLEKGVLPTDWTPHPNNSYFVLEKHESMILQNAGSISSKVSETDFTGETIVSKVNQTASTFKIDAKNIDLNGYVTAEDLEVRNDIIFGGELRGATGTFTGNLQAVGGTFTGSLEAVNGTFSGSLQGASGTFTGTVEGGTIVQDNPNGGSIRLDELGLRVYDQADNARIVFNIDETLEGFHGDSISLLFLEENGFPAFTITDYFSALMMESHKDIDITSTQMGIFLNGTQAPSGYGVNVDGGFYVNGDTEVKGGVYFGAYNPYFTTKGKLDTIDNRVYLHAGIDNQDTDARLRITRMDTEDTNLRYLDFFSDYTTVYGDFGVEGKILTNDWLPLDLLNGFTVYSSSDYYPSYMIDPMGFVHFRGALSGGDRNTKIATLPPEIRPSAVVRFDVGKGASSQGVAQITINSAGDMYVWGESDIANYLNMNQVIYYVG